MFKKTMTFDDLEGNPTSQTFYFNYNKKEIAELIEFGRILDFPPEPGIEYMPLDDMMTKLSTPREESGLTNTQNNEQAYMIFQNLILDAYGQKGADNVTFPKTVESRNYFKSHVAFPEMIFEFLGNEKLAAQFIESCLPPRLVAKAKEEMQSEAKTRLSSDTLAEMVQEADRRQQDPATRIEPGPEAAAKALGENAEVAQLAESVKDGGTSPFVAIEDLTEADILAMDDITFKKLDPQKLSQEQMIVAFRRKLQS